MRICSLLPSATEIVFALGLGDSLVGVSHECDFPEEVTQKTVVVRGRINQETTRSAEIDALVREQLQRAQSLYALEVETLSQLEPDLILTQELCQICAVDFREVQAATLALNPRPKILSLASTSLAGIFEDIRRVARSTHCIPRADALIASLEARIDRVRDRTSGLARRPRVACLEWLDPIFSAGHWIPEMVQLAGGEDVLARPGQPSATVSWDEVVRQSPEILILMPCGFDVARTMAEISLMTGRRGWNDLPAVCRQRVFAVGANALFSRPGPRLIDGLELMAQLIHPELFSEAVDAAMARNVRSDL